MKLSTTVSSNPKSDSEVEAILADPGFARYPTDHFVTAHYANEHWDKLELRPYHKLQLDPLAAALHYGQTVFEGLKAYELGDGSVSLFRPEENATRFASSARRLAMPPFPLDSFLDSIEALVQTDRRWIPKARGTSLYLRPLMFASESCLTVRPSTEYEFLLIALPAAPYFAATYQSISVLVIDQFVRAVKGGTGEAKCGANYSASMLAKQQAAAAGCSEGLWLDGQQHRYIEELGGMNVMFVEKQASGADRLITPPLNGTILHGVTRDCLLQLAPDLGYPVEQREITIEEVTEGATNGTITEAFACGTAAVIAPIGKLIFSDGRNLLFGDGTPGKTTTHLYDELVDIQLGTSERFPQWRHRVTVS